MSTPVPIVLTAQPVDVTINATDLNALLKLFCSNISGAINQQVSFFLEVPSDPGTNVGDIIYNTSQMSFKGWNTGAGKYLPITQPAVIGTIIQSFNQGDNAQAGYIQLNGRQITAIQGISTAQVAILNGLFPSGTLPTVQATSQQANLPASGSFSSISNPVVAPPAGQIGALPFSGTYNPAEEQALATNTETLLESTIALQTTVAAVIAQSEAVLDAVLNSGAVTIYAQVYIGPP